MKKPGITELENKTFSFRALNTCPLQLHFRIAVDYCLLELEVSLVVISMPFIPL